MVEHLGGHVPDALTAEGDVPYQPWPPAKVQAYLAQAVVHGEGKSVAFYAPFVAQRPVQAVAQCQCRVFDGVVFVYMQVAFGVDGQVEAAMFAYLFQHVVEEAEPGGYVAMPVPVQVNGNVNVRFMGRPPDFGTAFPRKKVF